MRADVDRRIVVEQRAHRPDVELLALDGRPLDHRALVAAQPVEPRGEQRLDRRRDGDVGQVAGRRPSDRPRGRAGRRRSASRASPRRTAALPSAASRMRARASSGSAARPRRFAISSPHSSSESGSSRIVAALNLPPPHAGRRSSSSGRAMQSTRIGASRDQSAMCSIRSRNVGSPQWMSSNTTTSGRVSRDGLEEASHRPEAPPRRRPSWSLTPKSCASVGAADRAARRRRAPRRSSARPRPERRSPRGPAASFTTSPTGQKVMPSPYGRHRPRRTVARPAPRRGTPRRAATCRRPAAPRTVNSWHDAVGDRGVERLPAAARAGVRVRPSASRAAAHARARPASTSTSRNARRPARTCPSARAARPARRRRRRGRGGSVSPPSRISPGLGGLLQPGGDVDGVAGDERLAGGASPATTSPVFTPVRTASATPRSRSSSLLSAASALAHLAPPRARRAARRPRGLRDAEDRHHRVADELLDGAAVALERRRASRRSSAP